MRIAVVGAGAMGSMYAGLLKAAGHDVWAVDVDTEHIRAIRTGGLRIEGASGDRIVQLAATTEPADVGEIDLLVVATKSMAAQEAARSTRDLLGAETAVLTIQNGLGAADLVADIVGEERLLVGVAGGFGASVVGPGHVHHHGMELIRLGERRGGVGERVERVAEAWRQAGFTVEVCDDIDRPIWDKLVCNACYAGICGMLELTIGEVLENRYAWQIAVRCAGEACDVARAAGIRMQIDDCERHVRDYGRAIPGARPSVLLDLLAGRPTEIEWINGAVARQGARIGMEAPTNQLVTTVVLAKQTAARHGSPRA